MATIVIKRKLNRKFITNKYNELKQVEYGNPKSKVALKYVIAKKTLSTRLKNKEKIFDAVKKGDNSICHHLRKESFSNLDQAIFKWFLIVWSKDVAVSALVLKNKAIEFTKKMKTFNIFMLQMIG